MSGLASGLPIPAVRLARTRRQRRPGGHGRCPYEPRHLPVVTSERLWWKPWRQRFWLRCWQCDLKNGPHDTVEAARAEAAKLERL